MKNLARSYFWWPKLDADIEKKGKKCSVCLQVRPANPPELIQSWD